MTRVGDRYELGELHRSLSRRAFTTAVQRLLPAVTAADLVPAAAGVRAQAVARDGALLDDFAFARPEPLPARVDLKTGRVRVLEHDTFRGKGGKVPGGAATALELPLDPANDLQSLTLRALANEVVLGLMAVTLER